MTRTARNDGTVTVDDLQQSSQEEFDRVTSTNYAKNEQKETSKDFEFSISASGGAPSGAFSASASFGTSTNDRNTDETNRDSTRTTGENNLQQSASSQITQDKKRTSFDQMTIEVEGGSQLIAATINDLYSPNFKHNLAAWLGSIPKYSKPFNMKFIPLTELLDDLADDFMDPECKRQCYELAAYSNRADGAYHDSTSDFCIKKVTVS